MAEEFALLRRRPGRDELAVADRYPDLEALGARAISQHGRTRRFSVWPSREAFRDAVVGAGRDDPARYQSEVVLAAQAQKLRFDLDGLAEADEPAARRDLEEAVRQGLWEVYGDAAVAVGLAPQFFWTQAHRRAGRLPAKRSWHCVVYNVAFPSGGEVDAFARRVHALLAQSPAGAVMDLGIYSAGGSRTLRALGCAKPEEPMRVKVAADPAQAAWPFPQQWRAASLCDVGGLPLLPQRLSVAAPPAPAEGQIPEGVGAALLANLPEYFVGLRFVRMVPCAARARSAHEAGLPKDFANGLTKSLAAIASFARLFPSVCAVCEREHSSDTPFALVVETGEGRYRAMLSCHRAQGREGRPYLRLPDFEGPPARREGAEGEGDEDEPPQKDPRWLRVLQATLENYESAAPGVRSRAALEPPPEAGAALEWLTYHEPRLRSLSTTRAEYEDEDDNGAYQTRVPRTVFVLAGLMVGKTQALLDYVRAAFPPAAFEEPRVLMVSCRRTFTSDLMRRFGELGFKSYSDFAAGTIAAPRVIVQVESLERYSLTAGAPDLLVIDEASSVLLQLCSPHVRSPTSVIQRFEWLLARSRQVVLMDARMGEQVFEPVRKCRGLGGGLVHENLWSKEYELGKRVEFTGDAADWLAALRASMGQGRRLAIFTNSKAAAERYRALYDEWGARDRQRAYLLTGETPEAEKRRFFADVNASVRGLGCFVATPVVTVGVSIDAEWFDEVFGDFGGDSCPAESCMQMLGRVRRPRLGRFVVLARPSVADGVNRKLACTVEAVLAEASAFALESVRAAAPFDPLAFALRTEIDAAGVTKLVPFGSFPAAVWAGNSALVNVSRQDFVARMAALLVESGAEVSALARAPMAARQAVRLANVQAKSATTAAAAMRLLAADDIHEDAVAELRERDDLTAEELAALRRADLRRRFSLGAGQFVELAEAWPGGPVECVSALQSPAMQKHFGRLRLALASPGDEAGVSRRLVSANARAIIDARAGLELDAPRCELEALRAAVSGRDVVLLEALASFLECFGIPVVLSTAPVLTRNVLAHLALFRLRVAPAAARLAHLAGPPRSLDFCQDRVAALESSCRRERLQALYDLAIILDRGYHALFGARVIAGTDRHCRHYFRVQFPPHFALPSRRPVLGPPAPADPSKIPVPSQALLYPATEQAFAAHDSDDDE